MITVYRISDSPERRDLSEVQTRSYGNNLPHIELLEDAGLNTTGFNCIEHAFGGLPWYEGFDTWELVNTHSFRVLKGLGFIGVEKSGPATHVAYLTDWGNERFAPMHYALVEDGLVVTSKFGDNGPVYRHDVRHLPDFYGEYAAFLSFQE